MACICDWPRECSGTGIINCDGCGGDQCVCTCGGEVSCPGCDYCEINSDESFEMESDEDDNRAGDWSETYVE